VNLLEAVTAARRRELLLDLAAAFVAMLLVPLLISVMDSPFSFTEWYSGLWPWSWLAFTAVYFGAIRYGRRTSDAVIWRILNGTLMSFVGTGLVVAVFFVVEGILDWTSAWPLILLGGMLALPAVLWISVWIWMRETRAPPNAAASG